jgi:hypothetical protein
MSSGSSSNNSFSSSSSSSSSSSYSSSSSCGSSSEPSAAMPPWDRPTALAAVRADGLNALRHPLCDPWRSDRKVVFAGTP